MKKIHYPVFLLICFVFLASSCYKLKGHYGGFQNFEPENRKITLEDIALPEGYQVEALATGLTYPTGLTLDEDGNVYVTEAGYCYGEIWTTPRLLKIGSQGEITEIAHGEKNGPWTGVDYKNGFFYVSEGGHLWGGKILKISKDGKSITPLVENLPSLGDHHTNSPIVGIDGYVYFGQGTATNSGVVGEDNYDFGWLKRSPEFHDIPCKNITLKGQNFKSDNPITKDKKDEVYTGAFSPYGTSTKENQVIEGKIPCTGAIMRVPIDGGDVELVAWGLRNPYGLAFGLDGRLFITENSYDTRGSRPAYGTGDVLWSVSQKGTWYGWPDYAGGEPMNTDDYETPSDDPEFLLAEHPQVPPKPIAIFGVHSSSNGLDFSKSDAFGFKGEAFVAQFGDMAPDVGRIYGPVGFKIVRVDINTGLIKEFMVNKGRVNGPASESKTGGIERPNSVKFDAEGNNLYIVDFGIMPITKTGPAPKKQTGVIWKVSRSEVTKAENE